MLSHVEMAVPAGTLTAEFCRDLDGLLVGVFGWEGTTRAGDPSDSQPKVERVYRLPTNQSVVLFEHTVAGNPSPDDHIGISVEPGAIDELLARCMKIASADRRMEFRHVVEGKASSIEGGPSTLRTFFVKYLVPVWIQVESHE